MVVLASATEMIYLTLMLHPTPIGEDKVQEGDIHLYKVK